MIAQDFSQVTLVIAQDQPEYIPLPVCISGNPDGCMAACYRLTWWERIKLLWTGKMWIEQLTFHRGFQPVRPSVNEPDWSTYGYEE